jgi:crossover junction endodeoxyribonuclease RuvC
MRIVGIDPGLQLTGYGCVDLLSPGKEPVLVEGGVLRLSAGEPMAFRLGQLFEDLAGILEELAPDLVVVEKLFSHYRHVRTSILMGHARGVVLLAAQRLGIHVDELAATEVKKAITGHGHASKEQVQLAVMHQCRLEQPPTPNGPHGGPYASTPSSPLKKSDHRLSTIIALRRQSTSSTDS